MKKYKIKNISGGPIVCTLADKKTTLRIKNNAVKVVEENQMTPYLWNIEKKNLITISENTAAISPKKTTATTSAAKKSASEIKESEK